MGHHSVFHAKNTLQRSTHTGYAICLLSEWRPTNASSLSNAFAASSLTRREFARGPAISPRVSSTRRWPIPPAAAPSQAPSANSTQHVNICTRRQLLLRQAAPLAAALLDRAPLGGARARRPAVLAGQRPRPAELTHGSRRCSPAISHGRQSSRAVRGGVHQRCPRPAKIGSGRAR